MRRALVIWQDAMARTTGLAAASVAEYMRDATAFVAWLERSGFPGRPGDVTAQDVRDYRDALLDAGRAPATVNRALVSLGLFLAAAGRAVDNPVRQVGRVDVVERPPQALSRNDWNGVRRAAAARLPRDHGLALALVCLLRFAGPRVGEVAALALSDVRLTARHGLLVIRRGKGLKHREVPLVLEAREPRQDYLEHRRGPTAGFSWASAVRWASAASGRSWQRWGRPRSLLPRSRRMPCATPLPRRSSTRRPTT